MLRTDMPEAAPDIHSNSGPGKQNVHGSTRMRQRHAVEPVAQPAPIKSTTKQQLRLSISLSLSSEASACPRRRWDGSDSHTVSLPYPRRPAAGLSDVHSPIELTVPSCPRDRGKRARTDMTALSEPSALRHRAPCSSHRTQGLWLAGTRYPTSPPRADRPASARRCSSSREAAKAIKLNEGTIQLLDAKTSPTGCGMHAR
jgi:hypothetical protein